ncbi:DNA nucleotidylexotransferase-like [Lissotriton helveticus]
MDGFQNSRMGPLKKKQKRMQPSSFPNKYKTKFNDIVLFIVERKMGTRRRVFLTELARRKGFRVEDYLSDYVTHVIAENNSGAEVLEWLQAETSRIISSFTILDISWFTECMGAGEPVEIERKHQLTRQDNCFSKSDILQPPPVPPVPQYACQRRTTIENHNRTFTNAFEILAEHYEFHENKGSCLAYRRAASVLKSLPFAIVAMRDVDGLPGFGDQIKGIVEEILEDGESSKVKEVLSDGWHKSIKLFTTIFGVGLKTAVKWHKLGIRTLEEIKEDKNLRLTNMQIAGLQHYEDLIGGVSNAEADEIIMLAKKAFCTFLPDAVVTLTGGFRSVSET